MANPLGRGKPPTYLEMKAKARETHARIKTLKNLKIINNTEYHNTYDQHWEKRLINLEDRLWFGPELDEGDFEIW